MAKKKGSNMVSAKELNDMFDMMHQMGRTDEDILVALYAMFQEDKLSVDNLRDMLKVLGYEFTPEFEAMSLEDKKTKGLTPFEELPIMDEEEQAGFWNFVKAVRERGMSNEDIVEFLLYNVQEDGMSKRKLQYVCKLLEVEWTDDCDSRYDYSYAIYENNHKRRKRTSREREENVTVMGPSIENTCMKCLHGKIIDPKALNCSMYKEKPSEVYFGGKPCPNFILCEEDIDLQEILDEMEDEK